MRLIVGKYYRTRSGEKIGPLRETDWPELLTSNGFLFNISNGTHGDADAAAPCINNQPNLDLISEWSDSSILSPLTIDAIAVDSLKWHFKNSDIDPLTEQAFRIVLLYYGEQS